MINVLVTVGVYDTIEQIRQNAIRMTLPQLPSVGDVIFPDGELKTRIEAKKKEWKLTGSINFVRHIGYYGSDIVVMLGGNPRLHTVDFYYKNNVVGGYLSAVPSVGDLVYVPDFDEQNYLYVESLSYSAVSNIVGIFLREKEVVPSVRVADSVDVYVTNDVNVNMNDATVDVRIVDQLGVLDVRTRREEYD